MDQTYNNTRGIEQIKNKLSTSLQISHELLDDLINMIVKKLDNNIGIMPVNGAVSSMNIVNEITSYLKNVSHKDILSKMEVFPFDSLTSGAVTRLDNNDVRETANSRMSETELSHDAMLIHNQIGDTDLLEEVAAYNFDGSLERKISVSNIDMVEYMENEDLSDEGRRSLGFLPADFDSTNVLSATPPTQEGHRRTIGIYGYDANGALYVKCPECLSSDVIPMGAGEYMCLQCEPCCSFDVDLLLDDLNPEMN